eukprot:TRINITY_DN13698_c0_g1_i1.p1 TRINITY_DN13698_c0_g1~~TRINITY_DN13698_c0_g1_i1.p1  ORF type:complete len:231 (-),score=21.18 TRINITY_DN13698_c0_g1_i1:24-716(-)
MAEEVEAIRPIVTLYGSSLKGLVLALAHRSPLLRLALPEPILRLIALHLQPPVFEPRWCHPKYLLNPGGSSVTWGLPGKEPAVAHPRMACDSPSQERQEWWWEIDLPHVCCVVGVLPKPPAVNTCTSPDVLPGFCGVHLADIHRPKLPQRKALRQPRKPVTARVMFQPGHVLFVEVVGSKDRVAKTVGVPKVGYLTLGCGFDCGRGGTATIRLVRLSSPKPWQPRICEKG